MKAVFSNRAYTAVLAETTEKIKTETGGLFLGTIKDDEKIYFGKEWGYETYWNVNKRW